MICRWPCFEKATQTSIKEFFVRCVALMVEATSLEEFGRVFSLTCAVGLQPHADSHLALNISSISTVSDARHELEEFISNRKIEMKLEKHTPRENVDYVAGPFQFNVNNTNEEWCDMTFNHEDISKLDDDTISRGRLGKWVALQIDQAGKL